MDKELWLIKLALGIKAGIDGKVSKGGREQRWLCGSDEKRFDAGRKSRINGRERGGKWEGREEWNASFELGIEVAANFVVWLARVGFTGAAVMDHCIAWGRGKFTGDLGHTLDGWLQTLPVYSFTSHWQQMEVYRRKLMVHGLFSDIKNLIYKSLCKFSFYWEIFCSFIGVCFFFFTLRILHLCA